MNKHIRLIPALALGIAVLSIPTLATAATTVTVGPQALLVAKGAGAVVSLEVTCDFGSRIISGGVLVNQRVGNGLSVGFGNNNSTIDCSGTLQTFEILVLAQLKPFHKGSAIANGNVFVCSNDFSVCNSAQANQAIQLVR